MPQSEISKERIKQLRQARGLSMDELVALTGGVISKQAISKYERGLIAPSPRILCHLAKALKVDVSTMLSRPDMEVNFLAYRKHSKLLKKEQSRIQGIVAEELAKRCEVQEINEIDSNDIPYQKFTIKNIVEAEEAADNLRKRWSLGLDPIASFVDVLEGNKIHVIEIEANEKFDGISAIIRYKNRNAMDPQAVAIVIRKGIPGDRQRMDCGHELGHVVLRVEKSVDEEAAAYRFGAAFLAPKELVYKEVGSRRSSVTIRELLMLKKRFGMSMQAILRRLKDLAIINETHYVQWLRTFSRLGYRKNELNPLTPEKPTWFKLNVLRAYQENAISRKRAEYLLDERMEDDKSSISLKQKKAFLKLPMEQRRRIMEEQASIMKSYYEKENSWRETGLGDL